MRRPVAHMAARECWKQGFGYKERACKQKRGERMSW